MSPTTAMLLFCAAAQLIGARTISDNTRSHMMHPQWTHSDFLDSPPKPMIAEVLRAPLYRPLASMSTSLHGQELTNMYVQAYKGLATLAYHVKEAMNNGKIGRNYWWPPAANFEAAEEDVLQLPRLKHVPLMSCIIYPTPTKNLQSFLTCHLRELTTKEFLEEGEWVGYEPTHYTPVDMEIQAPYKDIHFVVKSTDKSGIINVVAERAQDQRGAFRLEGTINPETGEVVFEQVYDDLATRRHDVARTWHWHAVLTPFGIVGSWDNVPDSPAHATGWFWLWKKSWGTGCVG